MASISNKNENEEQEEEARVPVLTVVKNSAILKNIVIVLDDDQTLLIGRHPRCNIVLTHPSVSRFHLRIRCNPNSRVLSLVDLASVHGTWLCGRRLEAGVSVELKEGDTFTLGVSTRLYRLSWLPLSQVDDFLPHHIIKDENVELTVEQEIPMAEGIVSLSCDEERKIHSGDDAFGVLNGTETSCFLPNSDGENKPYDGEIRVLTPPYAQSVHELDNAHDFVACPEVEMPGETNLFCTLTEYLTHNICLPVVEAVQGTNILHFQAPPDTFTGLPTSLEMHWSSLPTDIDSLSFVARDVAAETVIPPESEFGCTHGDNDKVEDSLTTGAEIFNSENTCLPVDEVIPDSKIHQIEVVEEVSVESVPDGEKQDECKEEYKPKMQDPNAKSCCEEGYSLDEIVEDNGNKCIENIDPAFFDERGLAAVTEIPTESEFGCTLTDNERIEDILATESRIINSENTCLLDEEEAIPITKFELINVVKEVAMDSTADGEKEDKCGKELKSMLQASLNAKSCHEEGNSVYEIAEDGGNKYASSIPSMSFEVESPDSSMPQEVVFNIKIENRTPQSLKAVPGCYGREILENHLEPIEKISTYGNIWSKRVKAASAPQVRARKSIFLSTCKVDTEVKMSRMKKGVMNKMPKDLSSVFDEEEETSTPNKENLNTYHLQCMRKKDKLQEIKHSNSHNLKANFSSNIYSAERLSTVSNKKKVAQEQKSRRKPLECRNNLTHDQDMMKLKKSSRVVGVPFQSLMNSGGNRKSVTTSAVKNVDDASICRQISNNHTKPSHISRDSREQKRSWDMVVDTASLLNKESRKALKLLQGLQGTRLIVPKLVIRELGSMKQQQFRIFRRTSQASLALEWIEECMEKTRWWIHIQCSREECRLTAPTPPSSPHGQFIKESWAFPGSNNSKECASPKNEDILDCALQYKSKENAGQLVLLSDDVALKIKSMAKGLLCETVEQFRQSLVNPFSERFMWPKSSPRGLTWSCQDDLVLREKYCKVPSKAGLKLIPEQFLYFQ